MRVRTISGGGSTRTEGPPMKPKNYSFKLGISSNTTGTEKKKNVVPLRLATSAGSEYPDWLTRIEDGKCFACRRRVTYGVSDVYLEDYRKVRTTGKICILIDANNDYRRYTVDSFLFSQLNVLVQEYDYVEEES